MSTMSYEMLGVAAGTKGLGVKIAATSSAGTTVHQAVAGTTDIDQVFLFATNQSASDVKLTLEWGATTADAQIEVTIEGEAGLKLVANGIPLRNELYVKAFASSADVIFIYGHVYRIDVS